MRKIPDSNKRISTNIHSENSIKKKRFKNRTCFKKEEKDFFQNDSNGMESKKIDEKTPYTNGKKKVYLIIIPKP